MAKSSRSSRSKDLSAAADSAKSKSQAIIPGQLEIGWSAPEIWQIFRMPILGLLIGVLALYSGLTSPVSPLNLGTGLGVIFILISGALIILEIREFPRPVIVFDSDSLTISRRGADPLSIAWPEIREIGVVETIKPRRFGHDNRLWLRLIPRQASAYADADSGAGPYRISGLTEGSLGVPIGQGSTRRDWLNDALTSANLPRLAAPTTAEIPADDRRGQFERETKR